MRWSELSRVQQQGLLQKLYRRAFTVDQRKKHTSGTERLWERAAEGKIEADGPEFLAECIRRTSVSDPWDCLGPGTRFDADGVEVDEDAGTETRPQGEEQAERTFHDIESSDRDEEEVPSNNIMDEATVRRMVAEAVAQALADADARERESERPRGRDSSWEERRGHSKACAMPPSSAARKTCDCGCANSMHMPTHRAGQMMTDFAHCA